MSSSFKTNENQSEETHSEFSVINTNHIYHVIHAISTTGFQKITFLWTMRQRETKPVASTDRSEVTGPGFTPRL